MHWSTLSLYQFKYPHYCTPSCIISSIQILKYTCLRRPQNYCLGI
uniref:Uncharacterized protein n=1 Tax=Anguilla anguilla TaxID=7936 RepID=A0A0E9QXV2_ANGAN